MAELVNELENVIYGLTKALDNLSKLAVLCQTDKDEEILISKAKEIKDQIRLFEAALSELKKNY